MAGGRTEDQGEGHGGRGSGQRRDLKPLALLAAVGLAIRAQQLLTHPEYPWDGPVIYVLAIGVLLWGLRGRRQEEPLLPGPEEPERGEVGSRQKPGRPFIGVVPGLLALGLAWIAYRGFADNHFSTVGTVAWFGALSAFLLATARGATPTALIRWLNHRLRAFRGVIGGGSLRFRIDPTTLAIAAILLMGIFFRVYRLPGVPAEMTSDHAEKLLDLHDVLHGARPIFFPRNTGREAMQFYLTAALIRLTPLTLSHLALKVGTALVSIVTIPLVYLLARSIYGREVGLLAAAFAALSRWHLAISRVGLRFPFTPLFTGLVLVFLFRAFRDNRRNDWLGCGLALGAGLHSYTAVRILPLLLVVLTLAKVAWDLIERYRGVSRPTEKGIGSYTERTSLSASFWINALLGAAASLLGFLPLLRYARDAPETFWFRVSTRVAETEAALPSSPWRTLANNLKDALLMFNHRGSTVWVNTVPGDPMLNCAVGALFVLGVVVALWHMFRRGDRRGLYLLLSLVILLLPSALSVAFPRENPSAVRAGGAIPIAALLAAVGTHAVSGDLRSLFSGGRRWLATLFPVFLLLAAACLTYGWYFVTYDRQYRRAAWNTTEMGEVLRGFAASVGDLDHAYHIPHPHWADTRNIAINAGDITWRNTIRDPDALHHHLEDEETRLYLLHVDDGESLDALRSHFPSGRLRHYSSAVPTKDFLIYLAP